MDKIIRRILGVFILSLSILSCRETSKEPDLLKAPRKIEDIKGHKIAVITGSVQDMKLSELGYGDDLVRLGSVPDGIVSLTSGTSDFLITDSAAVLGSRISKSGIVSLFSWGSFGECGFGLRKGDGELLKELDRFIIEMKADGRYDNLYSKWFNEDSADLPVTVHDFDPDGKPLNIGASSFFPFAFVKDREWTGFELEIVFSFAESRGYNPKVINADFPALIPALVSGRIDIIASGMLKTEERRKSLDFAETDYIANTCCFGMKNRFFPDDVQIQEDKEGFLSSIVTSFKRNFIEEERWVLVLQGLWETIVISLLSILLGAILGCAGCALKFSGKAFIRNSFNSFCNFIAGVPVLVLLMVMYYIIFKSAAISARAVAVTAFAINFGCSVSGIYYAGIKSVDHGQTEAGLAMGFTPLQTFLNFVLPQAKAQIAPLFKGDAVSLIKNTSIVGYIAIQDLTKVCDIIRSRTFDAFFPLIAISLVYFLLAWLIGMLIDLAGEKKA